MALWLESTSRETPKTAANPRSWKRQGTLEPSEEARPCGTLILISGFRNCETVHLCWFSNSVFWLCSHGTGDPSQTVLLQRGPGGSSGRAAALLMSHKRWALGPSWFYLGTPGPEVWGPSSAGSRQALLFQRWWWVEAKEELTAPLFLPLRPRAASVPEDSNSPVTQEPLSPRCAHRLSLLPLQLFQGWSGEGATAVLMLHLGLNNPTHPSYIYIFLLGIFSVPGPVPVTGYIRGKNTRYASLQVAHSLVREPGTRFKNRK